MEIQTEVEAAAEMFGFSIKHLVVTHKSVFGKGGINFSFYIKDNNYLPPWQPLHAEFNSFCSGGDIAKIARNISRAFFLNMAHGHAYKILDPSVANLRRSPQTGFFWPKAGDTVATINDNKLQLCAAGYHLVGLYGLPYWQGKLAREVFPISRRIIHDGDKFVVSSAVVGNNEKELTQEAYASALHDLLTRLVSIQAFGGLSYNIEQCVLPALQSPTEFLGPSGREARLFADRVIRILNRTNKTNMRLFIHYLRELFNSQYAFSSYVGNIASTLDDILGNDTIKYLGYSLMPSELYSCLFYRKVFNDRPIYG